MNRETLLRSLLPWSRREPPAPRTSIFDARLEQARLSELVLRRAAGLLAQPAADCDGTCGQVQAFCDGLTAGTPHLRLCWTWFGAPDTPEIVPEVIAGPAADYARALRIPRSWLTSLGPAFRVLDGQRLEPFNVSTASLYAPWREVATDHGVRSTLALPLASVVDERRGLLVLYADVPDYFAEVGVGLFEAVAQLIGSVLSQACRNAQLERQARTDPLTGLDNRAAAHETLAAWRERHPSTALSLLLMDLDHFKQINDSHGHAAGDVVLAACARRLQLALRRQDGIARWGGEEFVVWLPGTGAAHACLVAEKLRSVVCEAACALPDGRPVTVTVSTGLVELQAQEALDDAIARADRAMYASKRAGRNRVTIG
jgi:diguanylate cyclase (GGDEF)-like protein